MLDRLERLKFDDLKNLPFLQLEVFSTRACEITLVKLVHVGVLKVPREVAGCVWQLVRLISDQQIVASAKGRTVPFKAADSLVFKGLDQRILTLIRDREDESFPLEICFEVS